MVSPADSAPTPPDVFDPAAPLSGAFRAAIDARLDAFLADQGERLAAIGPETAPLVALAADLNTGGKRLRPAFAAWGFVATAGRPADPEPLLRAAASLDLLHLSALVHDDVMDASDTRRGRPAAHRQFEARHRDAGWRGEPTAFGQAGAILLGDLLTMWSVELLHRSGLAAGVLAAALPIVEAMRTEVTCGQYLDLVSQARGASSDAVAEANRVVEFKSAKYTVQRPVQFGAALGGADAALLGALGEYGSLIGRAFQFRDDVLGVFGDEAVTGKPAGDDLREGKRTLLLAAALDLAPAADAGRLAGLVGRADLDAAGVAEARALIDASGARAEVDERIERYLTEGLAALDAAALTPDGHAALTALARAAVYRDR